MGEKPLWAVSESKRRRLSVPRGVDRRIVGRAKVIERWTARLKAFGIGISGAEQRLVEFLGEKQVLETVESHDLVGEFCSVTRLIGE
jgi:hypothetical protein